MKIRNVLKEFEAHVHPAQAGGATQGKSEWKHYGDGTYRFKISVRNIPLSDNSKIDVMLDGIRIAQLVVRNNKAKFDIENDMSLGIPTVRVGQKLQINSGQTVLADGQYIEE